MKGSAPFLALPSPQSADITESAPKMALPCPQSTGITPGMALPSPGSDHKKESELVSSDLGLPDASNGGTPQQRLFDCEQRHRGLQDQVSALERRADSLKTRMEECSKRGLKKAVALKTCIGEQNDLQTTLEEQNANYESIVALDYEVESLKKDKEMLWIEYQNAEEELNECKEKKRSLLTLLCKGSVSEHHNSPHSKGKQILP